MGWHGDSLKTERGAPVLDEGPVWPAASAPALRLAEGGHQAWARDQLSLLGQIIGERDGLSCRATPTHRSVAQFRRHMIGNHNSKCRGLSTTS